jgi:hypothetical protein
LQSRLAEVRVANDPNDTEATNGVGPGITGASGDLIEGTGGNQGIGGTGQDEEADAAGMRPDERNMATREHLRPSGSATGTVGGGGPQATPADANGPGQPGGGGSGALGDVPGGIRNVSPANDAQGDANDVHAGEGQDGGARIGQRRAGNPGTEDEH